MSTLSLSPDELLTTTRAVRRRLDFDRPVPDELIQECLEIADQAPSASNHRGHGFIVVTDPEVKAAVAQHYKNAFEVYTTLPISAGNLEVDGTPRKAQQDRVMSSAQYLADRFEDVPAYVIPVINETFEGDGAVFECSQLGSVLPAAWSFQLAARARGLGTCWTTLHLLFEKEVGEILGLPDDIHQAALITVGYYTGESFKPAPRWDMEQKIHWNGW